MIIGSKILNKIYKSLDVEESLSINRFIENNLNKFIKIDDDLNYKNKFQTITNKNIFNNLYHNIQKLDHESKIKLISLTEDKQQFKTIIDNIIINKPFNYSSVKLGLIGENFVKQKFISFGLNVINSSKIYHTGDLNIIFDDYIILVEVKNKHKISKEDIEKFKYDMKYLEQQKNKKVYGLFISLKNDKINGVQLPINNISKSYISYNEILNDNYIKIYLSTIELINKHKILNSKDITSILKFNESLLEIEESKIKLEHEILNLSLKSKFELESQNKLLKNILSDIDLENKIEYDTINKLKLYINNKNWSLKEAKQIIGLYSIFKTKNDVIKFLKTYD